MNWQMTSIRHLLRFLPVLLLASANAVAGPYFGAIVTTNDVPAPSRKWVKDINTFMRSDSTNPPPTNAVVFVGSSSIRMWKTLAEDFPGNLVINRGFGGSQIIDSVVFADRIVIPYAPRVVVFYAGGNDINAGKHPNQLLDEFKQFARNVNKALPATKIFYVSIAPNPKRWHQIDRVQEANRLIQDYCKQGKQLHFINVYPEMLGPDGLPKPDIFLADRLHMNAKGYAIWREMIAPYIADQEALSRNPSP